MLLCLMSDWDQHTFWGCIYGSDCGALFRSACVYGDAPCAPGPTTHVQQQCISAFRLLSRLRCGLFAPH